MAALRPAGPAPTMQTSTSSVGRSTLVGSKSSRCLRGVECRERRRGGGRSRHRASMEKGRVKAERRAARARAGPTSESDGHNGARSDPSATIGRPPFAGPGNHAPRPMTRPPRERACPGPRGAERVSGVCPAGTRTWRTRSSSLVAGSESAVTAADGGHCARSGHTSDTPRSSLNVLLVLAAAVLRLPILPTRPRCPPMPP